MAEQRTSTRGWVTFEEFALVAAGVFDRAEREAVGPGEWDSEPGEEDR